MYEVILLQNQRLWIDKSTKGHTQHERDEEADIQCHRSAKETKPCRKLRKARYDRR